MNFKKLYMNFEKLYISFQSSSKDNVNKPRKRKVLKKQQVKSFQINVEKQDNITVSRTKVLMCDSIEAFLTNKHFCIEESIKNLYTKF